MRGKRRLHKRPNISRSSALQDLSSRWNAAWSSRRPSSLSARRAARSLTGRAVIIGKVRGKPLPMADGTTLVVTVHPSALLRIEDDDERHAAYRGFVADLKAAAAAGHARAGGEPVAVAPRSARWRLRPRPGAVLATPAWVRAAPICCMRLMSLDRRSRREHDAARRIATAGDGRVGLDFVDARHAELDAQRLPVKHQAGGWNRRKPRRRPARST